MRDAIDPILAAGGGVAARQALLQAVTRNQLDDEIRRRHLIRVAPRVYARPWDVDVGLSRERAILVACGPYAALSHTSALTQWRLPVPACADVHVTVPGTTLPRAAGRSVVVHRTQHPPHTIPLNGLRTVVREVAIVSSWPLLRGSDQRAPLLTACRERVVDIDELATVAASSRVRGKRSLERLIAAIRHGCESELELWGYTAVFAIPGLSHAARQVTVTVRGRRYRLDMAYEAQRVAVELDGRAFHASPVQWERDIERDAALATIGWQTIRLSHRRLTTDVDGCRRDVLRALEARRIVA